MEENQMIGDYKLIRTIGQGISGKVKLAVNTKNDQEVAIKIIKKSSFEQKPNLNQKIQREISLMKLIDHPHILGLVDVLESPRHLYIITEYSSKGELFDYLVQKRFLPQDEAVKFFRQIIYGLEYLHSLGICHRDLKPENILLDANYNIKIADFGFARFVQSNIAETSCGSPHYAAPEVIRGQPYEGKKADIWSCGVIFYALMAGYLPFDDPNIRNLLAKVKRGVYSMPKTFSPEAKALINGMLQIDPSNRFTIAQIKASQIFRSNLNPEYVLPAPPPTPNFTEPIPESALNSQILEILYKIGYTDTQALLSELKGDTPALSKVFYRMATNMIAIDQLNWDGDTGVDDTGIECEPAKQAFVNGIGPFHRMTGLPQSVPNQGPMSLAVRPDWDSFQAQSPEVLSDQTLQHENIEQSDAMLACQRAANAMGMRYLHPDDFTILLRGEDRETYIEVDSYRSGDGCVLELHLCAGSSELFNAFFEHVAELLDQDNKEEETL